MVVFVFIFCLLIIGCFFQHKNLNTAIFLFSTMIVLSIFAGMRGDIDNDYNSYKKIFDTIGNPVDYFTNYRYLSVFEPFYYLIPATYKLWHLDSYVPLFVFFAFLGVSFKLYSIWKLSDTIGLAVITYFSFFFILHEMTQIRVGIASGLLLLSFKFIHERKYISFLAIVFFAACFHYTALLFLPLYFLSAEKLNKKLWYMILIIPYVMYFFGLDFIKILSFITVGVFAEKLKIYQDMLDLGQFSDKVNILNVRVLIQLVLTLVFLFYADLLQTKNKYTFLLLKSLIISLSLFILFVNLPVFAFRFQELFGVVQIIIYPFVFYLFKEKYFGMFIVIILALLTLLFNLFYLQLLSPYF